MIIRGLDFARQNVVVGNSEEANSPTPGPALQARGELVARVISAAGAEATLEINGQRVVVQSHVALTAGDKLFVKVAEGQGGAIRLTIMANGPETGVSPAIAESDIDSLLRELGLPTDSRTRLAAQAQIARDSTVDKPALQRILADLRQFSTVTSREAGAVALLQKSNVAVTQEAVALVAARAEPNAPPQPVQRLAALVPELTALLKRLPARSAQAIIITDVLATLRGVPLDAQTAAPRVVEGLKQWIDKLTPRDNSPAARASATAAGARVPAGGSGQSGAIAQALAGLQRLLTPDGLETLMDAAPAADAETPAAPASASAKDPAEPIKEQAPAVNTEPAKQELARVGRVPASHHSAERLGITKAEQALAGPDLASQLSRLGTDLAGDKPGLGKLLHDAVAELRYTQLVNSPMPRTDGTGAEYLVPLMLPQLSQEHPEGRIQVFHKPGKQGEPIDPRNVRLVFVLETEHMKTVQADVAIRDGIVDLNIGVFEAEDQAFLAEHLDELEKAITDLGWETGRFGARRSRGLPPPMRQEEGLVEIKRFDRRV